MSDQSKRTDLQNNPHRMSPLAQKSRMLRLFPNRRHLQESGTPVCCSPPLALAPMVGLSHSAFRLLVLEIGGVGLFFSEMLSVSRLTIENETVSPFLCRTSAEYPFFYQIFVGPGQDVVPAVERLHSLNAQGIDLNLGCPAPTLRKQGAGSFMSPDTLKATLSQLRKSTDLVLSAKIRLGKELNEDTLLNFCRMLEDEGVDMLTVHGRLQGEKFCRKPKWDWIGKVKAALSIPVLANGGIFTVADARRCIELSNTDGLMLGRGAVIRPWLFADIAHEVYGAEKTHRPEKSEVYFRFTELLHERFRPERRLGRLKQFTSYFCGNFQFGHHLAAAVQNSSTMEEACEQAGRFFETAG